MAKKETKTTEAKAAKETKKEEKPKATVDVTSKESNEGQNKASETPKEEKPTEGTQNEKQELKSTKNEDSGNKESKEGKGTSESSAPEKTSNNPEGENNGHNSGMTYEEAEKEMLLGECIALPEWKGFWFSSLKEEKVHVLLQDGNIVDTPNEEYKQRNDWVVVTPTKEQEEILDIFWKNLESYENAKNENKDFESLVAIYFNRGKGTSFIKLKKKISIDDLRNRLNLPDGCSRNSEFVMSNGFIFDLESSQLTNKKA